MTSIHDYHKLTINANEASNGTKKVITRHSKQLEVTIPAGVRTGSLVKLSGALQITDGFYGDILIQIKVRSQHRGVSSVIAIASLSVIIICAVVIGYFTTNSRSTTSQIVAPPESSSDFITVFHNTQPYIEPIYTGQSLHLVNDNSASNPTWQQLMNFLVSDKTDQNQYIFESYVCTDYAEEVHNNAEAAGIKAAFVAVFFKGDEIGHTLNAFETTDYGLVYIDCTEFDTQIYIQEGAEYQSFFLFDNSEYYEFESLGIIEKVIIYW